MRRPSWFLLAAVLVACVAAWPLLSGPGLLNTRGGGDSPFLLQRLQQLETAVRDGHFPVRWMPDANYGYGYPFFNYYAPFAFYIAFLFRLLGFSLVRAIQLSQLAAFITAAWGAYRLGQRWWGDDTAAFLSSAAYTLAPFHLVNVYVRGDSIAEFWAMALYPWVVWAVCGQAGGEAAQRNQHTLFLALAYAALLVSHNISALIFSPFILLVGLVVVWRSQARLATLVRLAVGAGLGLALAAWFWLPALGEQAATQLGNITADYFNYERHFRTAAELSQITLLFDYSTTALQAFRMGLVQTLVLVGAGLAAVVGWLRRQPLAAWWGVALLATAVATLMMSPLSRPLWANLPLLPFTQFPWRFLSIQAFFGAMLVGGTAGWVPEKWRGTAVAVVLVSLLASSLGGLHPIYFPVADEAVTAEALAQYEWFTGNSGTTINSEYLAPAVNPRPVSSAWLATGQRWVARVVAGTAAVHLTSQRTAQQVWQAAVTGPEPATITIPLMLWPGWVAHTAAGAEIPLTAASGSGLATFTLPPGSHTLTVELQRTPMRRTAETVSWVTGMVVIGYWLLVIGRRWRTFLAGFSGVTFYSVLGVVVALLALRVWDGTRPAPTGPPTWDFGEMGYLHPAPEGVLFGNGARLARYEYSADVVQAGQTWRLDWEWSAAPADPSTPVTVAWYTPAVYFYNFVPPVAHTTAAFSAASRTITLTVPTSAPAGLYFPQLVWGDGAAALTATGVPRGPLSLRPVRLVSAPSHTGPSPAGLDVRVTAASQRPPTAAGHTVLDVAVAWFTARPLGASYKASWRLTSGTGLPFHSAQFDIQPGYGYRPTVGWPAGEWVADEVALFLPAERPFPPPYIQLVTLYDEATQTAVLTRRLGVWDVDAAGTLRFAPHQPHFTTPEGMVPLTAVFRNGAGEPQIALRGYLRQDTAEGVHLTLFWEALAGGLMADYRHFVHVLDPATGRPLAQHDAMPQADTYPTSQWVMGEVVADELFLPLADVPAGTFPLVVGLYEVVGESYPRLAAQTAEGVAWAESAVMVGEVGR